MQFWCDEYGGFSEALSCTYQHAVQTCCTAQGGVPADMLLTNQFTDVVDTDVNMTKTTASAAESSFAGCNSGGIVLVNYCRHILRSAKTFKQDTKADIVLGIFGKRNKFGLSSRSSSGG